MNNPTIGVKGEEMGKDIFVFEDEDANYCVIVGTKNIKKAEKALRKQEEEWYGKNHKEKPIPIEDFTGATIYYGTAKVGGEDFYYWGENPQDMFVGGKFETEYGFIASL